MNRLFAVAAATLALSGTAAAGALSDRPYMYHDENSSAQTLAPGAMPDENSSAQTLAPGAMPFAPHDTIVTTTVMHDRALLPETSVIETRERVLLPRATMWDRGLAPYSSYKDEDPIKNIFR